MSSDYAKTRRLRYRVDEHYRAKRVAQATGEKPELPPKEVWELKEVLDLLGVDKRVFDRYQAAGVIPRPTYPGVKRRYWKRQVTLLFRLFRRMREHGWPYVAPRYLGRHWQPYIAKLHSDWKESEYGEKTLYWKGDDHAV